MFIRNTPISCRRCATTVAGKEYTVTESSGRRVVKCDWRCHRCGFFNKSGIIKYI